MTKATQLVLAAFLVAAPALRGQMLCDPVSATAESASPAVSTAASAPEVVCIPDDAITGHEAPVPDNDPLLQRLLKYAKLSVRHRMAGLASYYSSFFDGRKTANGEIYRNRRYSAAHLTLPLGSWVEVTARATGKKIRLRVNDRGPYARKFVLDLSQAAARYLGVDRTPDRYVDIRVIALPGETPLPEDLAIPSIEEIEARAFNGSGAPVQAAAAK